jgi:hypothetical protein
MRIGVGFSPEVEFFQKLLAILFMRPSTSGVKALIAVALSGTAQALPFVQKGFPQAL